MLSLPIKKLLDAQIGLENQAHFNYLGMAVWCETAGYAGATAFFYRQAAEEREHMLKVMRYVSEQEQTPCIPIHEAVPTTYGHLQDVFEQALQHEQVITRSLHDKVAACLDAKDFTTMGFLQWFVEEQREEERTMQEVLKLFEVMKRDGVGIYTIDQALFDYPKQEEERAS